MVWKYQNKIAPIFYYGKSPKTNRKYLKIPDLQALTLGRIKKITLYMAQSREGLGGLVRKHSRLFLYSEDLACECGEVVWCKLVSTLRV